MTSEFVNRSGWWHLLCESKKCGVNLTPLPEAAAMPGAFTSAVLAALRQHDPAAHAALVRAAAAEAGLRCLTAEQARALDAYRHAVAADPRDTRDARDELLAMLADEQPSEEGESDGR